MCPSLRVLDRKVQVPTSFHCLWVQELCPNRTFAFFPNATEVHCTNGTESPFITLDIALEPESPSPSAWAGPVGLAAVLTVAIASAVAVVWCCCLPTGHAPPPAAVIVLAAPFGGDATLAREEEEEGPVTDVL